MTEHHGAFFSYRKRRNSQNRRVFISTSDRKGRVDGATVDAEGNYWASLIHEGAIACFSPDGIELRKIELPVIN